MRYIPTAHPTPGASTTAHVLLSLAATLGALLAAGPVLAQDASPLPLTGPAWELADKAYKAYARGDYRQAIISAREAQRQRPDVRELQELLDKSEAAQASQARGSQPAQRPRAATAQRAAPRPAAPIAPSAALAAPATTAASAAVAPPVQPGPTAPIAAPSPPAPAPAVAAAPAPAPDPAFTAADAAYKAHASGDYRQAVTLAQEATRLAPGNTDWQRLLAEARYGLAAQEIGALADQGRRPEARQRLEQARASGELAAAADVDIAYLNARVGDDAQALAAFNRAGASGKLANSAWQDAAFAAVRAGEDDQAIDYFKRTIDDVNGLKLKMSPQLLFNTRRAVAEVSREGGVIASLSYRGAVSGLGLVPGAGTDTLQAGVEAYWRPWGYRNGRYVELFARAFTTLYSKGGGATGSDTVQSALGIRYKPLTDTNLVGSFSRVFAAPGGRDDWLAQIGYSGGSGGDLRVDVPAWWTTRISAEAGHYLDAGRSYALAELQAGRSMRVGDAEGRWVLFPHLTLAADYDSAALDKSSIGIGPGISARYWFNEDTYSAPRSYVDITLQYRARLAGAQRAKGVFLNTTLSY